MIRICLVLLLAVGACARLPDFVPGAGGPGRQPPPDEIAATVAAPAPPASARTADDFDTTTAEQRATALRADPAPEELLGQTVASLGNPGEAGLWLETSLVEAPRAGRVVAPGGGAALVELRPGSGGARLSLAAMRLLGLSLTDLPTVEVYGR